MKTHVFIFVPVPVQRPAPSVSPAKVALRTPRKSYPFWTWFLPNPYPISPEDE